MKELDYKVVGEQLAAPFFPEEIEWRVQRTHVKNGAVQAIVVPFISSRAIQNRLDAVVGWHRWENTIQELPGGGFLQGITIRLSETNVITKFDGADRTNFESTKGGISGALKRAAVLFGIGRYLYNLDEVWVNVTDRRTTPNDIYVSQKDKRDSSKDIKGYFTPPTLPDWALPATSNVKQKDIKQLSNHNKAPNKVPPGLFECIYKGMIPKTGNGKKYYEICFESNEQMCVIYAIGEMVGRIEQLQLAEEDRVAISSEQLSNGTGEWVLNNIVKVS